MPHRKAWRSDSRSSWKTLLQETVRLWCSASRETKSQTSLSGFGKAVARYYELATKSPSNTGVRLLQLLETRLDNTVYRSGLVTNRSDARQLVAHGNVLVNGKKVSVPSFQVKTDSVISIAPKATTFDAIKQAVEAKINPPKWIETKGAAAHVLRLPERAEIGDDINERLIIEYYSR